MHPRVRRVEKQLAAYGSVEDFNLGHAVLALDIPDPGPGITRLYETLRFAGRPCGNVIAVIVVGIGVHDFLNQHAVRRIIEIDLGLPASGPAFRLDHINRFDTFALEHIHVVDPPPGILAVAERRLHG